MIDPRQVEREAIKDAEIERLLTVCKDKTVLLHDAYAQIEQLRAENKELRSKAQEFYEAWCKTRTTIAKMEGK